MEEVTSPVVIYTKNGGMHRYEGLKGLDKGSSIRGKDRVEKRLNNVRGRGLKYPLVYG